MFGFKDNDNAKSGPFSSGIYNFDCRGYRVEGDLHFKGNLEVEGSIVGNILSEDENARVRVLQGGSVKGEVWVGTVIINGNVKGDILRQQAGQVSC